MYIVIAYSWDVEEIFTTDFEVLEDAIAFINNLRINDLYSEIRLTKEIEWSSESI